MPEKNIEKKLRETCERMQRRARRELRERRKSRKKREVSILRKTAVLFEHGPSREELPGVGPWGGPNPI